MNYCSCHVDHTLNDMTYGIQLLHLLASYYRNLLLGSAAILHERQEHYIAPYVPVNGDKLQL